MNIANTTGIIIIILNLLNLVVTRNKPNSFMGIRTHTTTGSVASWNFSQTLFSILSILLTIITMFSLNKLVPENSFLKKKVWNLFLF